MKNYSKLIGIAIFIFILTRIDLNKLFTTTAQVDPSLLLLAVFTNIPHVYFKSSRWNLFLRNQSIHLSFTNAFFIYLASIYIGVITPGRLGEFVKALYLKKEKGVSLSRATSSILIDRLFDLYLLCILAGMAIWFFRLLGQFSAASLAFIGFFLITPALLLSERIVKPLLNVLFEKFLKEKFRIDIKESFEDFYSGVAQLISPGLITAALLTCMSYGIFFSQCYWIISAMHLEINFVVIALIMALVNLVSFLPISISGLGTRDAALIFLFSQIGLSPESAVSFSFLIFLVYYVAGGVFGAFALWKKPLDDFLPQR